MRRLSGYLMMAVLAVLLAGAAPALADSYFIYDTYGGTWHDANKTAANTDDDLMCWAAAASNVMAWGAWGTAAYNTTDLIFKHIQDHWTDNGGLMSWAWKWWFNGSPPPVSYYSYPDVPGGGNFYPTLNFSDYFGSASGGNIMNVIDTMLHQGQGVGLVISKSGATYSHAVTVWGYSYSDTGAYTSLFLTDSDDGVLGLREYPLIWQNDLWYLGGGYSGWTLGSIQSLGFSPIFNDPIDTGDKAGEVSPVPIAPTWLLLGTGLGSLFLLGRRRRNS
jgi:hypothetical protein